MQDLIDTFKAVTTGSILFIVVMVFYRGLDEYPRSVFTMELIFNMLIIGGSRFSIRYYHEMRERTNAKITKNILIAGAGKGGVFVLSEIRNNPRLGFHVIGFVDDNPLIKGVQIQGVPILGSTKDISQLVEKYNIDEIIIAIPSAKYKNISRIKEISQKSKVKVKILPAVGMIIRESSINSLLREVSYDELLGRKTIKFCRESDCNMLEAEIKNKAVLVTGGGGSIGSELCRQVAQHSPQILIIYDRYENSLYSLELELKKSFSQLKILPVIGDILDKDKIDRILKMYKVKIIYHAAAYKHVPMMEREPLEAVRNNIFGTMNVATLAATNSIEKFILISTDKAVKPANIMGTTKRICELIILGLNGFGTKFIAVRFGNVIGSNGSVIPLFKKQINDGGPVTITHPDITRYFMSIPEAVQLVMTAGAMGNGGEIFLLDMGEPIKIEDIAKELIQRSGLEPYSDIDIVYTGLRPGEKLHEELYWKGEGILPTKNKKITMLKINGKDYSTVFDVCKKVEECVKNNDINEVLKLLIEIVPESKIINKDNSAINEYLGFS